MERIYGAPERMPYLFLSQNDSVFMTQYRISVVISFKWFVGEIYTWGSRELPVNYNTYVLVSHGGVLCMDA